MEDWEALAYEDDFESRYADELELLNELDGQLKKNYKNTYSHEKINHRNTYYFILDH
jgi:hypothetical protein